MDKVVQDPEIKRLAAWMIWFWKHRSQVISLAGRYNLPSVSWLPRGIHVDATHAAPFGHYGVSVTWWPIRAVLDTARYPARSSVWHDAELVIYGNSIDLWKGDIRGIGVWSECSVDLWRDGVKTLVQLIDDHARQARVFPPGDDLDNYERMEQLQRLEEVREAEEALMEKLRRYSDRFHAKEDRANAVS